MDANEIDVEVQDLVERIRAASAGGTLRVSNGTPELLPEPPSSLPPVPGVDHLAPKSLKSQRVSELIAAAEKAVHVDRHIPKFLRRLFRKQGKYDQTILDLVSQLAKRIEQMHNHASLLYEHLKVQTRWLEIVASSRDTATRAIAQTIEHATGLEQELSRLTAEAASEADDLRTLQARQAQVESRVERLDSLSAQTDDRQRQYEAALQRIEDATAAARADLARTEERHLRDSAFLKSQITIYADLLRSISPERGASRKTTARQAVDEAHARSLDAFYVAFEDRFRGPRDEVKCRLEVYVPYILKAEAGSEERPVLDLGCGRGEWLELLQESHLTAHGVDLNQLMVQLCTEQQLRVTAGDALEYVTHSPPESLGAITAFHLIEHLPFAQLMELVQQSWRALRPGGLLIFETPNPANIQVGAHYFYRDYTHRRPLPADSTEFLVANAGFREVTVLPLNSAEALEIDTDNDDLTRRFNEFFYGPQDYAVIAVK